MYSYLFTNDLRISSLKKSLIKAATCYKNGTIPSASEDKSANNNIKTLGFYFNLTSDSKCTNLAVRGEVDLVILNFIKKFQFPNLRTKDAYELSKSDGIILAPLRLIIKLLYLMSLSLPKDEVYLSRNEIKYFIFFNEKVAKNRNPNLYELIGQLKAYRDTEILPENIYSGDYETEWKHCDRQLREMIKVVLCSKLVTEKDEIIYLSESNIKTNENQILEIVNYNEYWEGTELESYQCYMDYGKGKKAWYEILKEYYATYGYTGLHLFGFDYYKELANLQLKGIVKQAELSDAYDRELKKAMNLAELLNQRKHELNYKTDIDNKGFNYNRIIFGAPGTGKSHRLNLDKNTLLTDGGEYERVTFHPDYSYAGFVGTYKPVSLNGEISYKFVPGPFMRTLVKALKSGSSYNPKPYLLIVEEINRANVAAVFGDVFQLLDRKEGISEYPIQASEDIKNYLSDELGGSPSDYETIALPDNMMIWATMNSADQGVFPMDTAFKRRWDFTYLGINDAENNIIDKVVKLPGEENPIAWNSIRKGINAKMVALKINEDKQLGPYFINVDNIICNEDGLLDSKEFNNVFKNKIIMYLFEDAVKQRRGEIFSGCSDEHKHVYSEICKEYNEKGIEIFSSDIRDLIFKFEKERGVK